MGTDDNTFRRFDNRQHGERSPEEMRAELVKEMRRTFPSRAVDVALAANVAAPAIGAVSSWVSRQGGIAILAGDPGIGKTIAATWLAMQHLGRHRHVPTFLRAAEFAKLSRYDDEAQARWRVGFLVLDDLGVEYLDPKGSFAASLDELVDVFYGDTWRTLVVTTNNDPATFLSRYGARVLDRIRECGAWIQVTGPSLRGARS